LIDQGEAAAVGAKAGMGSDKLGFLDFKKRGDGGGLFFRDFYVSWPATAVGASFAKIFGGFRSFSCFHRVNLACGEERS
jgi:hypothetical protein